MPLTLLMSSDCRSKEEGYLMLLACPCPCPDSVMLQPSPASLVRRGRTGSTVVQWSTMVAGEE